jgi:outer membrane protein assembly factor BamB
MISLRFAFLCLALVIAAPHPFFGSVRQPQYLGEPVGTVIAQGVAFGKSPAGENQLYFATNGSPATFYAVDAETMEPVFSQALPGLDVVWAITRGSDDRIYFSGTRNGGIYRYCPQTRLLRHLGNNRTGDNWVWDMEASADGKIYGSTYPGAKVFEFDLQHEFARPWASGLTEEKYARGLGVTDSHVYVGIGTRAHLFRIGRTTQEVEEIPVPNRGNTGSSISKAWIYGGKILARSGGSRLFVIDEETLDVIRGAAEDHLAINYAISPPAPHNTNLIYYKYGTALFTYDLANDVVERVPLEQVLPAHPVRGWQWITLSKGGKSGDEVLVGLTEFGEFLQYNPKDHALEIKYPKVEPQGVLVQSLETAPDGRLYIGGYQGGMSIYDPAEGEVVARYPQFNQAEGIGFFQDQVYFGTYGSAKIFRFDPAKPGEFGQTSEFNPGMVFTLGQDQDRPFVLEKGNDRLFIGSVPGYGRLGGALTTYDPARGVWTVQRNVVENQSIIGLAYREGRLFGSTSVFGGLGSEPAAEAAMMFLLDAKTGKKLKEWTPEIPGIDQTPRAIGGLSFGPDGKLWAAAGGTIAVIDPQTLQVERARTIHPSNWKLSHYWRPVYLRWASDGRLFTTLGRKLTVIDPETLEAEVWDETSLMTIGLDGYIYYAKGSRLFRLPMN